MTLKAIVDKHLHKVVSRKLFVFLVSCGALFFGNLDSSDFVIVATSYIGTQGIVDAVVALKHGK